MRDKLRMAHILC